MNVMLKLQVKLRKKMDHKSVSFMCVQLFVAYAIVVNSKRLLLTV